MNLWKYVLGYGKKMWKTVVIFFLFSGIFLTLLLLYNIHPEPVFYAFLLCLVLGILILCVDFGIYVRKQRELDSLRENLFLEEGRVSRTVWNTGDPKLQYEELIGALQEERRQLEREKLHDYEAMKDYYTMWAHQIKNPIAAMRLLLQSQQGEGIKAMEVELFQIEQYVEMVLGYLRMENLSSDLVLENCDLDEIIRNAVKKYARIFVQKKIALQYEPVEATVLTDRKWLGFVLEQLLSNGLKYTKSGSLSIYLLSGQKTTLVVEDTGIGIYPQDLSRVFERGFTGCNGRKERHSTGIGLYSVKRILDKLGHEISLESRVGQGTKVFLKLDREEMEIF